MRFGFFPDSLRRVLGAKENIWIHAVSVGEVGVAARVIREFQMRFPSSHIVVSTVTETGYRLAQSRLGDTCSVIYAPMDMSMIVRRFVSVIRPRLYIATETELWPNLFWHLKQCSVPIALINGRISDRSFWGYRIARVFLRRTLEAVSVFCMQTRRDAERIVAIGALVSRVSVTGNIKFDDTPTMAGRSRADLGLNDGDAVFVAGSTHSGEEAIALEAFTTLRGEFHSLRLIVAPRHPQRIDEIIGLIERAGLRPVRFSSIGQQVMGANTVMVIDTIGDLPAVYQLADLVFVGKSLTVGGGHNIIEPAIAGKAIITGQRMGNFRDIADIFIEEGALVQVKNSAEFISVLGGLLRNSARVQELGRRARATVEKHRGAAVRTWERIAPLLR